MGRPRINIDKKQFEKLCGLQCSVEEIAAFFNCSVDTVERWCMREYKASFADIFFIKRGEGKIALRRAQFELAKKSAAMAIWLGKQYLGQTDKENAAEDSGEAHTVIFEIVGTGDVEK